MGLAVVGTCVNVIICNIVLRARAAARKLGVSEMMVRCIIVSISCIASLLLAGHRRRWHRRRRSSVESEVAHERLVIDLVDFGTRLSSPLCLNGLLIPKWRDWI